MLQHAQWFCFKKMFGQMNFFYFLSDLHDNYGQPRQLKNPGLVRNLVRFDQSCKSVFWLIKQAICDLVTSQAPSILIWFIGDLQHMTKVAKGFFWQQTFVLVQMIGVPKYFCYHWDSVPKPLLALLMAIIEVYLCLWYQR